MGKSELVLIKDVYNLEELVTILGGNVEFNEILRSSSGCQIQRENNVEHNFGEDEKKFDKMEATSLSKGGVITSMKRALSNLPTYFLSISYYN